MVEEEYLNSFPFAAEVHGESLAGRATRVASAHVVRSKQDPRSVTLRCQPKDAGDYLIGVDGPCRSDQMILDQPAAIIHQQCARNPNLLPEAAILQDLDCLRWTPEFLPVQPSTIHSFGFRRFGPNESVHGGVFDPQYVEDGLRYLTASTEDAFD
jgi:hypothetical protein